MQLRSALRRDAHAFADIAKRMVAEIMRAYEVSLTRRKATDQSIQLGRIFSLDRHKRRISAPIIRDVFSFGELRVDR